MPINTVEEAKKYSDKVHLHLMELAELSIDAGLNSHAGIWYAIAAAFKDSTDEVKTITDMMEMYLEHKMKSERAELREKLYGDKG